MVELWKKILIILTSFELQEIKDRERAKEAARLVVDSNIHRRATQIEIRPKYLLPDTNCYIDHLKSEFGRENNGTSV